MDIHKNSRSIPALCFIAGFAVAFPVAWIVFTPKPSPIGIVREEPIGRDVLETFLRTVENGDFAAIRDQGGEIFRKGRVVAAADVFSRFEANSLPPYTVYAFFNHNEPDKTQRVMLTLDDGGKVVSFMAEEMAVNAF